MVKSASISLRAQALCLLEEGVPLSRIQERTGLARSAIFKIRNRAIERGYSRAANFSFQDAFFLDAPRSGRPREMDAEKEGKQYEKIGAINKYLIYILGALEAFVDNSATTRRSKAADFGADFGLCQMTML